MSALDCELPFAIWTDATFFEKAAAEGEGVGGSGKRRRIAGVASAEDEDQEGESLIQKGMDWSYFLEKGFFNDNHDRSIAGIIGYPESVDLYRAGQRLPNGNIAKAHCTWVEGYLLDNDPRADSIWKKGLSLQGTPRALGFSVEGKSRMRSPDNRTVIKSLVRNCAVTHMPVHAGTRANLFLKSLARAHDASPEDLERAWKAFEAALRQTPKLITKAQAVDLVVSRYPGLSEKKARRLVELIAARRTPK